MLLVKNRKQNKCLNSKYLSRYLERPIKAIDSIKKPPVGTEPHEGLFHGDIVMLTDYCI